MAAVLSWGTAQKGSLDFGRSLPAPRLKPTRSKARGGRAFRALPPPAGCLGLAGGAAASTGKAPTISYGLGPPFLSVRQSSKQPPDYPGKPGFAGFLAFLQPRQLSAQPTLRFRGLTLDQEVSHRPHAPALGRWFRTRRPRLAVQSGRCACSPARRAGGRARRLRRAPG